MFGGQHVPDGGNPPSGASAAKNEGGPHFARGCGPDCRSLIAAVRNGRIATEHPNGFECHGTLAVLFLGTGHGSL